MKIFTRIANTLMLAGFFITLGTAGSADLGKLTLSQIITYLLIGLALLGLGTALHCRIEKVLRHTR